MNPTLEILEECSEVYYDYYYKSLNDGVLDDAGIYSFLCDNGFWNDEEEKRLNTDIPKYIENCKVELYESLFDGNRRERIKLYLGRAKKELENIYRTRHEWDYLGCHGVALFARWQRLIELCTRHKNKRYNFSEIKPHEILNYLNSSVLSDTSIRELARTDPWRSMWSCYKSGSKLMDNSVSIWTDHQKRLVAYSVFYDNIYEAHDCPSDDVIDDDDMLDGWITLKKREIAKEKEKNAINNRLGESAKHQEVFIPVDREDVNKVYSMNDMYNRTIIQSRLKTIQEKGIVSEHELPDVKQERYMQKTNMMKEANGRTKRN